MKIYEENLEYPKGKGWEVVSEADMALAEETPINPKMAKILELEVEDD